MWVNYAWEIFSMILEAFTIKIKYFIIIKLESMKEKLFYGYFIKIYIKKLVLWIILQLFNPFSPFTCPETNELHF